MVTFFGKIRYDLIAKSKFYKYLKYAFGEIVLVVIGILIAIQINNWNEENIKDVLFQDSMEQIYNGLKADIDNYDSLKKGLIEQIHLIDLVLNNSDSLNIFEIPFALHYIYWDFITIKSETDYFAQNLIYNPENGQQKFLAKRLANYVMSINSFKSQINIDLNEILHEKGLPRPDLNPYNPQASLVIDSAYFTLNQMNIASNLIHSENFRSILKTIRVKTNYDIQNILNIIAESKSIISGIKTKYPDVRIIFENVGIIGTAINGFDDVGAISTPMEETDFAIYETELYLKKGVVKFRSNDTWFKNWGGDSFPKGEAIHDGNNIIIDQSGLYHVHLDLNSNKYFFTRLNN
ncbi:MAG: DUF6090 family protein [Candidatus Thorarchaeota archaeon]